MKKFLIIGAGISGATIANRLCSQLDCLIDIWEERTHVAGNCHTERDSKTNILIHKFGPHIFNTDSEKVWNFVQQFGQWMPFSNRVKAITPKGTFSLPINLLTINQFFNKTFTPKEAKVYIQSLCHKFLQEPTNFEESALSLVGKEIYENFFLGYTTKQWGCDPKELSASILKRLPLRYNYNDDYYEKKYQAIPLEGYTHIITNMLAHPNIKVSLGKKFTEHERKRAETLYDHIFYTGPIDAFFNYEEGDLGYRTTIFERVQTTESDYQGNAVINYTDRNVPWTRILEHKHLAPWEHHEQTVVFREYSKESRRDDIPYYPKRLEQDKKLLEKYRNHAMALALAQYQPKLNKKTGNKSRRETKAITSFIGRLATYKYLDMSPCIEEALAFSKNFVENIEQEKLPPIFPTDII
jgi:UDP-galactopyranose mutase